MWDDPVWVEGALSTPRSLRPWASSSCITHFDLLGRHQEVATFFEFCTDTSFQLSSSSHFHYGLSLGTAALAGWVFISIWERTVSKSPLTVEVWEKPDRCASQVLWQIKSSSPGGGGWPQSDRIGETSVIQAEEHWCPCYPRQWIQKAATQNSKHHRQGVLFSALEEGLTPGPCLCLLLPVTPVSPQRETWAALTTYSLKGGGSSVDIHWHA